MILILSIFAGFVSSVVTAISILTQKLLRNLQRYVRDWARARRVQRLEMRNIDHEEKSRKKNSSMITSIFPGREKVIS